MPPHLRLKHSLKIYPPFSFFLNISENIKINIPIVINISAKSFLHSQVRIIVGTIYKVGDETLEPNEIKNILEGKDRNLSGPTAPAEGLYLEKVEYPNDLLDDVSKLFESTNELSILNK